MSLKDRWVYPHGDPSIVLFDQCIQRGWLDFPEDGGSTLELGCCETDFAMWWKKANPRALMVGVDVNPDPGGYDVFVRGDASVSHDSATVPLPAGVHATSHWEAVIALGSVEHFGLGFYGDPINAHADAEALDKACAALKPGGWLYYDVPWTPASYYITDNRHFRVYDDAHLASCLTPTGMVLEHQAWARGVNEGLELVDGRPTEPFSPFWYVVRVLRKN